MQKVSVAKIDLYLFNLINSFAKKSRTLDFFGIFFAKYLGYVLFFSLVIIALVARDWAIFFVPLACGLLARLGINESIYFFYQRKRPMEVMPANVLIYKPANTSFPSSHTSFFFALSLCLLLFNIPLAIMFLVASCSIGFFRIFCGVHWPSDIVGGIFTGLFSFFMILLAKIILHL